jgi:hypothetical protein
MNDEADPSKVLEFSISRSSTHLPSHSLSLSPGQSATALRLALFVRGTGRRRR